MFIWTAFQIYKSVDYRWKQNKFRILNQLPDSWRRGIHWYNSENGILPEAKQILLEPSTRKQLVEIYSEDIKKLEKLIRGSFCLALPLNDIHAHSVAIIDPVGSKAGLDHYDLSLLNQLKEMGCDIHFCFFFFQIFKVTTARLILIIGRNILCCLWFLYFENTGE